MQTRHYVPRTPGDPPASGAPREAIKIDFAKRLQQALIEKGWNQSELARRATGHLQGKGKIGRDKVSHYIRGVAIPRPVQLAAIAKALGKSPADLLPTAPTPGDRAPTVDMRQLEDGNVWLRINRATSMPTALKILSLLNEGEQS